MKTVIVGESVSVNACECEDGDCGCKCKCECMHVGIDHATGRSVGLVLASLGFRFHDQDWSLVCWFRAMVLVLLPGVRVRCWLCWCSWRCCVVMDEGVSHPLCVRTGMATLFIPLRAARMSNLGLGADLPRLHPEGERWDGGNLLLLLHGYVWCVCISLCNVL